MKRRWNLAFAVVAFARVAFASPDDAPRVELPLGPFVRPGRPLDVRVVGGADRVRAPGTPWALPQGERGDEFVVQLTEAATGALRLEIDRGGRIEEASLQAETLTVEGTVYGVRGDAAVPEGARAVRLASGGLPTVPEGWLSLDGIAGGAEPGDWGSRSRLGPRGVGFWDPLLLPPGSEPFLATAEASARSPALPLDAATVLGLVAGVEVVLVLLLSLRSDGPWKRAAWLSVPALAGFAYVASGDRLPGAISAEATAVWCDPIESTLVLVRVEARRAGRASFDLPAGVSSAAVLRYSGDDTSVRTVQAGRRVDVDLAAGETRLFAYAARRRLGWREDHGVEGALWQAAAVTPRIAAWIESAGLSAKPEAWYGFPPELLPRARGAAVFAGLHAVALARAPLK